MIRVLKTDVLWFDGRKRRVKRPGDVFEADPGLEARLVAEGVAEYAGADGGPDAGAAGADAPDAADPGFEGMTKAEVAEVAKSYGIAVGKKTKAELIEAIEGADGMAPALEAAEVER